MSARMLHHLGASRILPPREVVNVLVERTPHHWYWLGEFFDDNLDRAALITWAPPAEARAGYIVARLLWCWDNGAVGVRRLQLDNTCALATCINPAHWTRVGVVPKHVTLPLGAQARIVLGPGQGRDGRPIVHIKHEDGLFTVCGVSMKGHAPDQSVITCKLCVKRWRERGQPLIEVAPP